MVGRYTLCISEGQGMKGKIKIYTIYISTFIGETKVQTNGISDWGYYTNLSPIEVVKSTRS